MISLPPMVQAYIQSEKQVQMTVQDGQVYLEPLFAKPKNPIL